MGIAESMAPSTKGLKASASDGGYFYFVSDAKGENAAIMVYGKKKDADGKKTARSGRGLLKDFKKEFGKAFFSQGEILAGSGLVFEIARGSAKPAVMKRAFKTSSLLHEGVGKGVLGLLKGAKIKMAQPESSDTAPDTATTTAPPEVDEAGMKAWAARPEVLALIGDLDLSEEELAEMFEAEQAFEAHAATMPREADEETALQLQQAETEALLDALADGEARLEALLESGDTDAAKVLELTLDDQRVALAQKNAIGPDPFRSGELSETDQQALTSAMFAGMKLLMARLTETRSQIDDELSAMQELEEVSQDDRRRILDRRDELARELAAIETQFTATRSRARS